MNMSIKCLIKYVVLITICIFVVSLVCICTTAVQVVDSVSDDCSKYMSHAVVCDYTTTTVCENTTEETEGIVETTVEEMDVFVETTTKETVVNTLPAETTEEMTEAVTEDCDDSWFDDVNFDGSVSSKDIPLYASWDTVGYISCKGVDMYNIPITYNWSQDICDARDIVMDPYGYHMFGQGYANVICGHNYKALRNLHNVKTGDKILITTVYGGNFLYEVEYSGHAFVYQPNGHFYGVCDYTTGQYVLQRNEEGNYLGVATCYDDNITDERWFVKARLIKGTTITE